MGLGGLLSKTAVSEAISGLRAVHPCCCSYCMAGDLARADQAQLSKIYCHKISTMCYASAYPAIGQSTCTELARGPWITGGASRVMTVRPNSIVKNYEERSWAPRRYPLYRGT